MDRTSPRGWLVRVPLFLSLACLSALLPAYIFVTVVDHNVPSWLADSYSRIPVYLLSLRDLFLVYWWEAFIIGSLGGLAMFVLGWHRFGWRLRAP